MKTRFAPSPTGFLHVGGLRTALFAYLLAKREGGTFLLRIEDTDRERFVEGGAENILRSLQVAGIHIDEGVTFAASGEIVQKGEHGPYIQSQRLDVYKKYVQLLIDKEQAYYCFCSKERLEKLRAQQERKKEPTGYDRHCRNLSQDTLADQLAQGTPHVIRLSMPTDGVATFNDVVRGDVSFDNARIDDQVLMKSDGYPTYHLAVVVDDHEMGITHVVRGEEWLSSTPKHITLYKAFGWDIPIYAHLPLLVNEKKQKLSKRHGDVAVEDFLEKGYLPEALVNFIAFLGWNPGDEREFFSLYELEQAFSLEGVGKAAAVFNREKLDWYNKQYMMTMELSVLTNCALPFFVHAGLVNAHTAPNGEWQLQPGQIEYLQKLVALERGRATTLAQLAEHTGFIFAEELELDPTLLIWRKSTKEDAKQKLIELHSMLERVAEGEWEQQYLEQIILAWISEHGYTNGEVLWPMRTALSGQKNSPGPFEIADVLGKEKTLSRLKRAAAKL